MSASPWYAKRTVAVAAALVPIVAPINGDYFTFRNRGSVALEIHTDTVDATAYDTLDVGVQDGMYAPYRAKGSVWDTRFAIGDIVAWIKSSDGSAQTVSVTWFR
jgi:hypothetical protein